MEIVLKLGSLQALILSTLLFKRKSNNKANVYLSILVFLLGALCLHYSYQSLDWFLKYPHLIRIDWGILLLFGPLLYLYTLRITKAKTSTATLIISFIPYVLHLLVMMPFHLKSGESKILILDYFTSTIATGTDTYATYYILLRVLIFTVSCYYSYVSIKVVNGYQSSLLHEYSDLDRLQLQWLKSLLIVFILFSSVFLMTTIATYQDPYPLFDYDLYYFLGAFILIYVLSYKALGQPNIFIHQMDISAKEPQQERQSSSLTMLANKLKEFMKNDKPFLNGELTATELANQMDISRHQLSEILNRELNASFYDYINILRIEEFKERVQSKKHEHLTLLAIALDSGFNSKTTFNTFFKKATGLTPSQYKKSLK